jgi:hypothetical protein
MCITISWRAAGVRVSEGAKRSSLLYSVYIGSGAHPASYPMGTAGGLFPQGKSGRCVKLTIQLPILFKILVTNINAYMFLYGANGSVDG